MRSQSEKLKAIAAMALGLGVIVLGIAFAIASPPSPGDASAPTPTLDAPARTPGPPTPAPTRLPYAIEGWWGLDFAASSLVQPTLDPGGVTMASSLELHAGIAVYGSGFGGGCDSRRGTFTTDGINLTITLGSNADGGCNQRAIDDVVARLARVIRQSLAPCPAGYRFPSGELAPTDGSCRQLWLYDTNPQPILVYVSLPSG